jgi:hypothetical protein
MSDEITALQAELAAAAADKSNQKSKEALHFSTKTPEAKLVTVTINDDIAAMDRMRRERAPFAQRIEKAINVYNYIMANPNVFAAIPKLRNSCIGKAHEFMESEFAHYREQDGFDAARARLRTVMRSFLDWTADVLPHNVHYKP